jgi:hypothetical protein
MNGRAVACSRITATPGEGGTVKRATPSSGARLLSSFYRNVSSSWFGISQHGRSLIPTEVEEPANTSMTRVVNWTVALKK